MTTVSMTEVLQEALDNLTLMGYIVKTANTGDLLTTRMQITHSGMVYISEITILKILMEHIIKPGDFTKVKDKVLH